MSSIITYNYKPQQGMGSFSLINEANEAIAITECTFTTNTSIQDHPWGDFPWDFTLSSHLNEDGTYTHHCKFSSPLTLQAHQSLTMTYTIGTVNGLLQIAMPPYNATVTYSDNPTPQMISINNAYQGETPDVLKNKRITVYYESWGQYTTPYNASNIPVDKVNEIVYAFIGFDTAGNVRALDPWSDGQQIPTIMMQTQRYDYLNFTLSFGGWGYNGLFEGLCTNSQAIHNFAKNAVKVMIESHANGIDLDWEYPQTAEHVSGLITLLEAIRSEMKTQNVPNAHLSIAAPAGIDKITVLSQNDWTKVASLLDHINVMTYDYFGAWNEWSDFLAPLQLDPTRDPAALSNGLSKYYNVEDSMNAYLAFGIDPQKLSLGFPAYGRSMYVNSTQNDGLYQTVTGTPNGQSDNTGMFPYDSIYKTLHHEPLNLPSDLNGKAGILPNDLMAYSPETDPLLNYAKTPVATSQSENLFLSYEDTVSAHIKTEYLKEHDFGGCIQWCIDNDYLANPENSMIAAIFNTLSEKSTVQAAPKAKQDLATLRQHAMEVIKTKIDILEHFLNDLFKMLIQLRIPTQAMAPSLLRQLAESLATLKQLSQNDINGFLESQEFDETSFLNIQEKFQSCLKEMDKISASLTPYLNFQQKNTLKAKSNDVQNLCKFTRIFTKTGAHAVHAITPDGRHFDVAATPENIDILFSAQRMHEMKSKP